MRGDVASQARQLFVALELHARLPLLGLVTRQRRLGRDLAHLAQAVGGDQPVLVGAQVTRRDRRSVVGRRARIATLPRLVGIQVADAGGEGRERMQRFAERIQAQRLHVVFQIRDGAGTVSERVKAPSWLGAMLIGPVRRSRYSRPIAALPTRLLASVLSVVRPAP